MGHLLVLGHGPSTGPDLIVAPIEGRREHLRTRWVDLDAGEPVPGLEDVAGVVSLGGLMDWDDDDPWLPAERELMAAAVADGVPVLGLCLGAQQLAVALGGEVAELATLDADVARLSRTGAGRDHDVVAGWPDDSPAVFHHRDSVVRLPPGATQLLDGSAVTPAAWADASDTALAVQFHPEASPATVRAWSHALGDDVPYDRDAYLERVERAAPWTAAAGVALVARWLDVRVLPRG